MRTTIAIDPGVHTGFAMTIDGDLVHVVTMTFTEAQQFVLNRIQQHPIEDLQLVIEDPRNQWVPREKYDLARLKGVGSVEAHFKLWVEFCEHYSIGYRTPKPGKYRRIDAMTFAQWTGWKGRTSEHARAAAMMVWESKPFNAQRA